VLIADTTGELAKLTQLADLVFIGKSIPPNNGGQTPIEASSLGKPLLFGPNMTNFRNASASLVAIGAAEVVADAASLRATALRLMRDEARRSRMATVAANWHIENQVATARTIEKIAEFLEK
jgi:3-deoxy-D-manno-octulosonic-acid transferase